MVLCVKKQMIKTLLLSTEEEDLRKGAGIIKDGSGTQFDPECVEVFIESPAEVRKVLKRYQEIQ